MFKKIAVVICAFALAMGLCGCNNDNESTNETEHAREYGRFVLVEEQTTFDIIYDKYTLAMYAVSDSPYNYGSFELLVNADGTPLLYEKSEWHEEE